MPQKTRADSAGTAAARLSPPRKTMPVLSLSLRPQTPHEQKSFEAALELLVTELVRQHLSRQGENHGESEFGR